MCVSVARSVPWQSVVLHQIRRVRLDHRHFVDLNIGLLVCEFYHHYVLDKPSERLYTEGQK